MLGSCRCFSSPLACPASLFPRKDLCDCIGPTWIIQNHYLVFTSLIKSTESLSPCKVHICRLWAWGTSSRNHYFGRDMACVPQNMSPCWHFGMLSWRGSSTHSVTSSPSFPTHDSAPPFHKATRVSCSQPSSWAFVHTVPQCPACPSPRLSVH